MKEKGNEFFELGTFGIKGGIEHGFIVGTKDGTGVLVVVGQKVELRK